MPSWAWLHDHRLDARGHPGRDTVLRPARGEPRSLASDHYESCGRRAAQLSIFSAVEFCLWDALDDATNFQRNFSIGEVEVEDGVIYHKTEYRERRNHFAYFACSEKPAGFDTQRDDFLGAYRGWDRPPSWNKAILQFHRTRMATHRVVPGARNTRSRGTEANHLRLGLFRESER